MQFNQMAKKRGGKTSKRKTSRSSSETKSPKRMVVASQRKFNLVISNLLFFAVLFIIFLGLYYVSSNEFYVNLFGMLSIIAGFVSLALFIVYLVFLVLRYLRK